MMKNKYSASTLPELLIVIILSGILFLMLFDGLNIVNKYGNMLNKRLATKAELFYSHSILERLLEETDSIRYYSEENKLSFYKSGEIKRIILIDSCGLCVVNGELKDTLFTTEFSYQLHSANESETDIDSITIRTKIGKDSLILEYGIPFHYNSLYTNHIHGTIR